ncbi:MAG TPA: plasmid stabilization protein [Casimicrobiaceae bacterium]|nr:plasmid stabilization protein [Casimicrobiaceae bacterium]
MASITIRGLDEATKDRLRLRAARNRCSMEDEARNILRSALVEKATPAADLGVSIRKRFGALGGIDLALPRRAAIREPPKPRSR